MRNMQRKGNAIDFVNDTESAIAGGSLVFFDAGGAPFVGVASTTVPAGASGSARVEGVFLLSPKAGGAVTQGAPLYADTDTGEVSTAAEGRVYVGRAWEAALSEASGVYCRINFMPPAPAATSSTSGDSDA